MSRWRPRSLGWAQVPILIIVVIIASATLSSTFTTIRSSDIDLDGDDGSKDIQTDLLLDEWPSDFEEMFTITQVGTQAYLRCEVRSTYEQGRWLWEDGEFEKYDIGQWTGRTPFDYERANIRPLVDWLGALPIGKDTRYLALESSTPMDWNSSLEVMRPNEVIDSEYHIRYLGYPKLSYEDLRAATVSPLQDQEYLGVPEDIRDGVAELASIVTSLEYTPYDKALAIRDHLLSNYDYTFNFSKAPEGYDPVEWFLFNSKEGVCTHFNSAFALMARSLAIPTRLVSGYLINPELESQTVFAKQAHAYAEIKLDEIGWIVMDATPLAPLDEYVDPNVNDFDITGMIFNDTNQNGIRDEDGGNGTPEGPLSDVMVRIYGPNMISETLYSNEDGKFRYVARSTGDYDVYVLEDERWSPTTPVEVSLTIGEDELSDLNFGFVPSEPPDGDDSSYYMDILEIGVGESQRKNSKWNVDCALRDIDGNAIIAPEIYLYLDIPDLDRRWLIGKKSVGSTNFLPSNVSSVVCTVPKWLMPGQYSLIARYAGDSVIAPCEDFGTVKIVGDVKILLNVPDYVLQDSNGSVNVKIRDAISENIALGFPVLMTFDEETSLTGTLDALLGASFPINTHDPGLHTIRCQFNGTEFYLPGEAIVSYTVTNPSFILSTPKLVRGESSSLYGRIVLGDIAMPEVQINITIDRITNVTAVTNEIGEIIAIVEVSDEAPVGEYALSYDSLAVQGDTTISVVARTALTVYQKGGEILANLTDEHGNPLPGAAIIVYYDKSHVQASTGPDGIVGVPIDSSDPVNCFVFFEGNDSYIPSYGNSTFVPTVKASDWLWFPAILVVISVLITVSVVKRKRPEKVMAPEVLRKEERSEGVLEKGPHEVLIPDIDRGMPWVWSGDSLRLKVLTPDAEIRLYLDGDVIQLATVGGSAEAVLEVGPGRHVIKIEGRSGRTVVAIRMVEYRQEVLEMFGHAMKHWIPVKEIGPEMSPREVFIAIDELGSSPKTDDALNIIEIAAYSDHPVGRSEYEAVFKALYMMGGLA